MLTFKKMYERENGEMWIVKLDGETIANIKFRQGWNSQNGDSEQKFEISMHSGSEFNLDKFICGSVEFKR